MQDRDYDWITFDCYGTLVDWEEGIASAVGRMAREAGVELSFEAIIAAHCEIEPQVEAESFRSYRDVLTETARRIARRFEWNLAEADAGFLADSLGDWRVFPDTNPALERLVAAGNRLGILSNVDDRLLEATRRNLAVDFDLLITAERVGSYKPALGHFEAARQRIDSGRWLHAAQSYFHDIEPCAGAGIPSAWVNRKAEKPYRDARPTIEVASMAALAERLA